MKIYSVIEIYGIMRKVELTIPLARFDCDLEKYIIGMISKRIIKNNKRVIENINIISNGIRDDVIKNKYNKDYKI